MTLDDIKHIFHTSAVGEIDSIIHRSNEVVVNIFLKENIYIVISIADINGKIEYCVTTRNDN